MWSLAMTSIPSSTFLAVKVLGPKTEQDKSTIWAEVKMMLSSVREAWQSRSENEPVDTYMNY